MSEKLKLNLHQTSDGMGDRSAPTDGREAAQSSSPISINSASEGEARPLDSQSEDFTAVGSRGVWIKRG